MLKEMLVIPVILGAGIIGGTNGPSKDGIGDKIIPDFPALQMTIDSGIEIGTNVNRLQDGAIYVIKSALDQNYALTLEHDNITNGDNIVLKEKYVSEYTRYSAALNQCFVARKETDRFGEDAWSFTPYRKEAYVLKFSEDSDMPGGAKDTLSVRKKIEDDPFIDMRQTPECSVYSGSFRVFGQSLGFEAPSRFRIGNMDEYGNEFDFAILDDEIEDGVTKVRLDYYDEEMPENYQWYFEKANSLGINVDNVYSIEGDTPIYCDFKVPADGYYTIKVRNANFLQPELIANDFVDVVMYLYENGPVMCFMNANSEGTDEIIEHVYLNPMNNYSIALNSRNHPGKVVLSVMGYENAYCVTYASDEPGHDFRKVGNDFASDMSNAFMQMPVRNLVNPNANEILNKKDINGKARLQNPYFMMVSEEGSQTGKIKLNATTEIGYTDLPSMEGCEVALWLSTNSAFNNSCIAYRAAKNKKAHNSIGFRGNVTPELAELFSYYFWREYLWEDDLFLGLDRVVQDLARELNVSRYADISILHPIVYTRNPSGSISVTQY